MHILFVFFIASQFRYSIFGLVTLGSEFPLFWLNKHNFTADVAEAIVLVIMLLEGMVFFPCFMEITYTVYISYRAKWRSLMSKKYIYIQDILYFKVVLHKFTGNHNNTSSYCCMSLLHINAV